MLFGVLQVAEREPVAPRVKLVSQDWVADVGEVHADLVGPPALRLAAHHPEAAETLLDFVKCHGFAGAVRGGADGHFLTRNRMKADRLLDVVAVTLGDAVDEGQILLVNLAVLKLRRPAGDGPIRS